MKHSGTVGISLMHSLTSPNTYTPLLDFMSSSSFLRIGPINSFMTSQNFSAWMKYLIIERLKNEKLFGQTLGKLVTWELSNVSHRNPRKEIWPVTLAITPKSRKQPRHYFGWKNIQVIKLLHLDLSTFTASWMTSQSAKLLRRRKPLTRVNTFLNLLINKCFCSQWKVNKNELI